MVKTEDRQKVVREKGWGGGWNRRASNKRGWGDGGWSRRSSGNGEREDGGRRRKASGKGHRDKKIGLEGLGRVSEEADGVGMCSPIKHICLFYKETP